MQLQTPSGRYFFPDAQMAVPKRPLISASFHFHFHFRSRFRNRLLLVPGGLQRAIQCRYIRRHGSFGGKQFLVLEVWALTLPRRAPHPQSLPYSPSSLVSTVELLLRLSLSPIARPGLQAAASHPNRPGREQHAALLSHTPCLSSARLSSSPSLPSPSHHSLPFSILVRSPPSKLGRTL